jgi:hypothetical protein
MALVQATVKATIKAEIIAAMGSTSDGDDKVNKLAEALAKAVIDILKNQMVATAPGGGGPCTVS